MSSWRSVVRHARRSVALRPGPPDVPAPAQHGVGVAGYCRDTGRPEPDSPAAFVRAILESLAFKYRVVIESMEQLTGQPVTEIRIVGGGSRNRLLNQFTADAPATW